MNINSIKTLALSLAGLAIVASCANDIDVPRVDESNYRTSENNLAFITDKYGYSRQDSLIFNEKGSIDFYINLSKAATTDQEYTLMYDTKALKNYNKVHGTNIKALPEKLVKVGGTAKVAAGAMKSSKGTVEYTSAEELEKNGRSGVEGQGRVRTHRA